MITEALREFKDPMHGVHLETVAFIADSAQLVAERAGIALQRDRDDLDEFDGALLIADDRIVFSIYGRCRVGYDFCQIQMPLARLSILADLARILEILRVPESRLTQIDLHYFKMKYE